MLGALVPVMAGIALAGRMQKKDLVTMTWIGDGGTSTGAFHEGINFAAVQKLPLPSPFGTIIQALILIIAAVVIAQRAGLF